MKNRNSIGSMEKRLPRYYRYLRSLLMNGIMKTSSSEIGKALGLTPSQVRADLSTFAGNGVKGYGYNVKLLYTDISRKSGIADGMSAVIVGNKDEDYTYLRLCLEGRAVSVEGVIGNDDGAVNEIEKCSADILVVAKWTTDISSLIDAIKKSSVKGVWNMTQTDIDAGVPVINLPLGDILLSLMTKIKEGGHEI